MRRQPKQARSQERVHHILDVAEQLFIELGYEQTTTRAIATRAGVPVGSLYQFFPDLFLHKIFQKLQLQMHPLYEKY